MKNFFVGLCSFVALSHAISGCQDKPQEEEGAALLSQTHAPRGTMTCSGVSTTEYSDPGKSWSTHMVYQVVVPRDVDALRQIREQDAFVTAWRQKIPGEKYGPLRLQYAQGNTGTWTHGPQFKFKLQRRTPTSYELTHKVYNVAGRHGTTVLRANITCNQSVESIPAEPQATGGAPRNSSNCNWFSLAPGVSTIVLWGHGTENWDIGQGQYTVAPGTQFGLTGRYPATATRVHVFIKDSGDNDLNGRKGYVDRSLLLQTCK